MRLEEIGETFHEYIARVRKPYNEQIRWMLERGCSAEDLLYAIRLKKRATQYFAARWIPKGFIMHLEPGEQFPEHILSPNLA